MVEKYVPSAGDIVILNFNPQSGHEQQGRRPALVVSARAFNQKTGLVFVCPITNTDNGFLYHVPLGKSQKTTGFVMVEQFKSLDVMARKARFVERVSSTVMRQVRHLISLTVS